MKVRLVIECDGADVGKFLGIMPRSANFTVTKVNTMPKVGPVGQAIMDEMTPKKPKSARRKGLPRGRDIILEELTKGPRAWGELMKACEMAGHKSNSISGRIHELMKEGLIHKDAAKMYRLQDTEKVA